MKTLHSIFIEPVRHYLTFLSSLIRNEIVYHQNIRQNLRELVSIYEIFLTISVFLSLSILLLIEYFTFSHDNQLTAIMPILILATVTVLILFLSRSRDLPGSVHSLYYLFLFFTAYYYSEIPGVMTESRADDAWYLIELTVVIAQSLRPGKFPGLPVILVILIHGLFFTDYETAGIKDLFHLMHFLWISFISLFTETILYFTTIYYLELKSQKSQQHEELLLAQRVYNNLFPVFNENEFLCMSVYRHAENQTGGDLYDIIQLREGNLGFFLADISGHGISSAMMSAAMKAIINRMPYGSRSDPYAFLHYLDKSMSEEYGSHHASAVYLFLDFHHKEAKLSNAGHPPVLYSKQNNHFSELKAHGTLIGLGLNQKEIPQVNINIGKGDRFLIYTDGLLEYEDKYGNVADSIDIKSYAEQARALCGDDFLKYILNSITTRPDFYAFRDDVLMVLLEIK
jgi:hypothetical protein